MSLNGKLSNDGHYCPVGASAGSSAGAESSVVSVFFFEVFGAGVSS
jgi:hypothetical protein